MLKWLHLVDLLVQQCLGEALLVWAHGRRNQGKLAQGDRAPLQKPAEEEAEAPDEDDDGYGSDLMGDDEDRARLAAMTEMEREMELFERSEARDRRREARRNARLLKQPLLKEQAWAPRPCLLSWTAADAYGAQCLTRLVGQALCSRQPTLACLCTADAARREAHLYLWLLDPHSGG